jgi:MFS family permease
MIMLIIARAVQGLGGGGIFSSVFIIISDLIPIRERGKYNAVVGAMFAIANVVGPLLGGVFTDQVTWRWAFWINLPIGAITLVVVILYLNIPTSGGNIKEKLKRVDYFGSALIISALICILLAISWGGKDYAWNSGIVIGLLCAGAVLLALFVVYEGKWAIEPIAPTRLFKNRNLALVFAINFFFSTAFISLVIYLPVYFQVIRGATATSSGLQMLPLLMSLVVFAMASGFLMERTGRINIWIQVGTAILTVGVGLLYTLRTSSNKGQEIGYLLLIGTGLGLVIQTTLLAAQAATRVRDLAVVTSLCNFFQTVGGVIGIAVGSAVFNNLVASELQSKLGGLPGMTPQTLFGIQNSVAVLRQMPEAVQLLAEEAFMTSLDTVFVMFVPFVGIAFLLSLFLEDKRLDKTAAAQAPPAMA